MYSKRIQFIDLFSANSHTFFIQMWQYSFDELKTSAFYFHFEFSHLKERTDISQLIILIDSFQIRKFVMWQNHKLWEPYIFNAMLMLDLVKYLIAQSNEFWIDKCSTFHSWNSANRLQSTRWHFEIGEMIFNSIWWCPPRAWDKYIWNCNGDFQNWLKSENEIEKKTSTYKRICYFSCRHLTFWHPNHLSNKYSCHMKSLFQWHRMFKPTIRKRS